MPEQVTYLTEAKEAVKDVGNIASQINDILKTADAQASVRAEAIQIINSMCDALQLACDLIAKEISTSIVNFNDIQNSGEEEEHRSYFRRTANRFSDASLAILLHDGKVCGELHALGDGFKQPFSPQGRSAVSFSESLIAFFTRSTRMSMALDGLYRGERNYLGSLNEFLAEVRDKAEDAAGVFEDIARLRGDGSALVHLMREKRRVMQDQVRTIRDAADECVAKLH